jgi:citronellol/citronellal dehydrogenase
VSQPIDPTPSHLDTRSALATFDSSARGRVSAQTCNVRVESEVRALMEAAVARHGRLDFLVCSAGGQFPSPAEAISTKGWSAVVETNLTGAFLCAREAYSAWMGIHSNGGAIVFITAEVDNGFPGMAHTGAARAGIANLARSLAVEWAPAGIRVNAVAPGIIASSGLDSYAPEFREAVISTAAAHIPFQRLGTCEEVCATRCQASFHTACVIRSALTRYETSVSAAPLRP